MIIATFSHNILRYSDAAQLQRRSTDAVTELVLHCCVYWPNWSGWRQKVIQPPRTFMILSWWWPLGHLKWHLPAIQFILAVQLIPILTHLSSRWTVPLSLLIIYSLRFSLWASVEICKGDKFISGHGSHRNDIIILVDKNLYEFSSAWSLSNFWPYFSCCSTEWTDSCDDYNSVIWTGEPGCSSHCCKNRGHDRNKVKHGILCLLHLFSWFNHDISYSEIIHTNKKFSKDDLGG